MPSIRRRLPAVSTNPTLAGREPNKLGYHWIKITRTKRPGHFPASREVNVALVSRPHAGFQFAGKFRRRAAMPLNTLQGFAVQSVWDG
jgi:hypothetical protein